MPEHKIEIEIKWENDVSFEVTSKEDDGPTLTLIKMDENCCIATLWPAVTDILRRYIRFLMTKIGKDMAQ